MLGITAACKNTQTRARKHTQKHNRADKKNIPSKRSDKKDKKKKRQRKGTQTHKQLTDYSKQPKMYIITYEYRNTYTLYRIHSEHEVHYIYSISKATAAQQHSTNSTCTTVSTLWHSVPEPEFGEARSKTACASPEPRPRLPPPAPPQKHPLLPLNSPQQEAWHSRDFAPLLCCPVSKTPTPDVFQATQEAGGVFMGGEGG